MDLWCPAGLRDAVHSDPQAELGRQGARAPQRILRLAHRNPQIAPIGAAKREGRFRGHARI